MMPGAQVGLELGSAPGRRPFARGFTPTTPSFPSTGLYAWLDASDSLTIDPGTSRVTQWLDKWNGHTATQTDTAHQPYVNSVNGLQCAYFPDGSQSYLNADYLTAGCFNNHDPWAMSFVWNVGRQDINQFALSLLGSSGVFAGMLGSNLYGERTLSATVNNVASNQSSGPMVYSLNFDGGTLRLRKNGATVAATASTFDAGQSIAWIGGDPRDGGTRYIFANFCELVVHNAYDLATVGAVESYLTTKWNAVY